MAEREQVVIHKSGDGFGTGCGVGCGLLTALAAGLLLVFFGGLLLCGGCAALVSTLPTAATPASVKTATTGR